MKIVDLHVDTLMHLLAHEKEGRPLNLLKNPLQVDLTRAQASSYGGQVFACFVDLGAPAQTTSHYEDALAMIQIFHQQAEEHQKILAWAGDLASYRANEEKGLISGFLSVEEGGIIGEDLDKLEELYQRGVRLLTLTWNYENSLGYPNSRTDFQGRGLKDFGLEALAKMEDLGIIADASHLSDAGFYDLVQKGKRPFLASHSNSRAIQNHPRNLTDAMIKDLADRGGIMGLNFCPAFLEGEKSTLRAMLAHVQHIIKVGGSEVLALGTDFDGISPVNLEVKGVEDMPLLLRALEKSGLSSSQIEGIFYRNFEKFLANYES